MNVLILLKRSLLTVLLCVASIAAYAHESRPIYIEIKETASNTYQLQWKTPPSLPYYNLPNVSFPANCQEKSQLTQLNAPDGLVQRINYHCPEGLTGETLTIRYPGPNPSVSSLVRYHTLKGEQHTDVLSPEETRWTVPLGETASGVAKQYIVLGIQHIWGGIDHLLFVVCLLWVAGTRKRILITITGFTIAHSITLALSALNLVRLPIPPVEASIALSIVFLATEIVRGKSNSLTWRYPIAVSASFGLLHGFGFAAALNDIGLPQTELLVGLLFFNLGVEIGQIVFAAGLITLALIFKKLIQQWGNQETLLYASRMVSSYIVGSLACFWLFERCLGFIP